MFLVSVLLTALLTPAYDPVATALENYNKIRSYKVTLRSDAQGSSEIIRYYYKKPGMIRMEFIKPHKGAVLVYHHSKKTVRLRPFNFFKPLVLSLSPENRLVKSSTGDRVDESDIGTLLHAVIRLQQNGTTEISGSEHIGGKNTIKVIVKGKEDFAVDSIHHYILWLDTRTNLPLKASAYDMNGTLIKKVLMDDLRINIDFPDDLFEL
jgi:outer membrane lipoprotein-sorting protein